MTDTTYRLANVLGRGLLRGLAMEVRVHGGARIPRNGPVILAATHVSFLDFVVLERAAVDQRRYVRFLTQRQAWSHPLVARAMDAMRHVSVDREAPAAAYLTARRLLRRGEAVGIFPEAGISHAFTVRALMPGAVALALETGAPLVPVAIWGPQKITSVGDPTRRPEPLRHQVADVSVGPPLAVADVETGTHDLGIVLTAMLETLQLLPEHRLRPGELDDRYPRHLGGRAPDVARGQLLDTVPFSARSPTWGPAGGAAAESRRRPGAPPASSA